MCRRSAVAGRDHRSAQVTKGTTLAYAYPSRLVSPFLILISSVSCTDCFDKHFVQCGRHLIANTHSTSALPQIVLMHWSLSGMGCQYWEERCQPHHPNYKEEECVPSFMVLETPPLDAAYAMNIIQVYPWDETGRSFLLQCPQLSSSKLK